MSFVRSAFVSAAIFGMVASGVGLAQTATPPKQESSSSTSSKSYTETVSPCPPRLHRISTIFDRLARSLSTAAYPR